MSTKQETLSALPRVDTLCKQALLLLNQARLHYHGCFVDKRDQESINELFEAPAEQISKLARTSIDKLRQDMLADKPLNLKEDELSSALHQLIESRAAATLYRSSALQAACPCSQNEQDTHINLSARFKELRTANLRLTTEDLSAIDLCALRYLLDSYLKLKSPGLIRMINATGVILHTNLGRAPLSESAQERIAEISRSYSNLEYNLEQAARGKRSSHVEELLCFLTGAEAACIVNNNAAAVMLVLREFSMGKEALVSRGELVEIGGSFRIPEIMELSGAKMLEVGTTNKTHLSDFKRALCPQSSLILKVHPSNYRIVGFSESPHPSELCMLAHQHGCLAYEDQGSGVLFNLEELNMEHERTVQEALADGFDLVSCSGDKLLGATQAGIIFGKKELIDRLKVNPLMRALRADKLCLAGLEASLQTYLLPKEIRINKTPAFKMFSCDLKKLEERAQNLRRLTYKELASYQTPQATHSIKLDICRDLLSVVGGGSLPLQTLPSLALSLSISYTTQTEDNGHRTRIHTLSAQRLQSALLQESPIPILGRVVNNQLAFDLRTIQDKELEELACLLAYNCYKLCNADYQLCR